MANDYKRPELQEKCPACGWRLDADAYRCPKCMIYFCINCRRRVTATDPQYQCLNQKCHYYGKLLCRVCTTKVPMYVNKKIPQYEEGVWKKIAVAAVLLGILSSIVIPMKSVGESIAITTFIVGLVWAAAEGKPITRRTTYISREEVYGYYRGCIACNEEVDVLHD